MTSRLWPTLSVRAVAGAVAATLAVGSAALAAQAPSGERLNDKDVKALLERVDHDRDRFEDQLDGKLKRSIIRGAGGEVNVEKYLDDLQENVKRLLVRFTPTYAASAEATTVLRQGTDIQRYMSTLPANFDGASEWNRLAASLGELAAVYGTALPLVEGQQARRLNDGEVRKTAENIAKGADAYRKELDSALKKDKTVDKATRDAAVKDAATFKEEAKRVASLVGDGKPASGEAKALLQHAAALQAASAKRQLPASVLTAWGAMQADLEKISQAFGIPK
jgi:hypothetical protein